MTSDAGPVAVMSKLGYLISGPLTSASACAPTSTSTTLLLLNSPRNDNLPDLWSLESLGIKPPADSDNDSFIREYCDSSVKKADGMYSVKLPWKPHHDELSNNKALAYHRTRATVKQLEKTPTLLDTYGSIIDDYEKRGFIEKVQNDDSPNDRTYYIPHHSIIRESKTTPVRIVFDCSSHQKGKASLNDCLETGSPKFNDISSILMRFRLSKYGLISDIEKAFLQIGIEEQDRDATRFFWLQDPKDPNSPMYIYRFKRILFGANCSAFILRSTVYHHLQTHDSEIAADITHNIYVDNICVGCDSTDQAVRFYKESRQMMADGNFNLRSWSTNCPEVQKLAEGEKVLDNTDSVNSIGMQWKIKPDELTFHQKSIDTHDLTVTKRLILQRTSRLYDPLGILCPVTIKAHMLLQRLWKDSIDWDTPLNTDFVAECKCLSNDISKAAIISVPRCIFNENIKNSIVDIHMFGDASSKAHGTAAYIRYGAASHLLRAKSRVAPIKPLTIPQLELLAATITARLHAHVVETISHQVNKINSFLWSDSQMDSF